MAYNYQNEIKINELVKNESNLIVISEIDGNLFKKYNYINSDVINHDRKYFYFLANNLLNKNREGLFLILKQSKKTKNIKDFKQDEQVFIQSSRNPTNLTKQKYDIFKIDGQIFKEKFSRWNSQSKN